mmetsp:Transcript_41908/g.101072  ORF Transcript_41908/g.101072 Transcript_41908/m.101072 type:complete len:171 (+) Transcript_41908:423-935(+)
MKRVLLERVLLALALAAGAGSGGHAFQCGAGVGVRASLGAWRGAGALPPPVAAAAFVGGSRLLPLRAGAPSGRRMAGRPHQGGPRMQRVGSNTIDFFKVLGVGPNTSTEEIKQKYRVLAKENHPDTSEAGDAKEQFQLINEAYRMLSDPVLRRALTEGLARRGGGGGMGV